MQILLNVLFIFNCICFRKLKQTTYSLPIEMLVFKVWSLKRDKKKFVIIEDDTDIHNRLIEKGTDHYSSKAF